MDVCKIMKICGFYLCYQLIMSFPFWKTDYVFNYKISFNATKSPLLYFTYLDKCHSDLLNLTMRDGNVIPYLSKCMHLGTTIYTTLYKDNVIDVLNELYKRTNYLLTDFSFTISNLLIIYCVN